MLLNKIKVNSPVVDVCFAATNSQVNLHVATCDGGINIFTPRDLFFEREFPRSLKEAPEPRSLDSLQKLKQTLGGVNLNSGLKRNPSARSQQASQQASVDCRQNHPLIPTEESVASQGGGSTDLRSESKETTQSSRNFSKTATSNADQKHLAPPSRPEKRDHSLRKPKTNSSNNIKLALESARLELLARQQQSAKASEISMKNNKTGTSFTPRYHDLVSLQNIPAQSKKRIVAPQFKKVTYSSEEEDAQIDPVSDDEPWFEKGKKLGSNEKFYLSYDKGNILSHQNVSNL